MNDKDKKAGIICIIFFMFVAPIIILLINIFFIGRPEPFFTSIYSSIPYWIISILIALLYARATFRVIPPNRFTMAAVRSGYIGTIIIFVGIVILSSLAGIYWLTESNPQGLLHTFADDTMAIIGYAYMSLGGAIIGFIFVLSLITLVIGLIKGILNKEQVPPFLN